MRAARSARRNDGNSAETPAVRETAVRRFNKAVSNPKQMETAGEPGGFLITLPYGSRADWVQNGLAAGQAVITAGGETVNVDRAEILSTAEVADQLPASEQRLLKLFNVEQILQVRRSEP